MGMVVRTNTMSTNAYRQLSTNNTQLSKCLEKLSSGYRINRAGDDASGLAISEKMKAQIQGLTQASSNSQDGISLVQTAEGALTEVHSMLNRMVSLATKSANGTIQDNVDRDAIQTEVDSLNTEITRIAKSTNFNGISLLDGTMGSSGTAAAITTTAGANASGTAAYNRVFTMADSTVDAADDDTIAITYKDASGADQTATFVMKMGATASNGEIPTFMFRTGYQVSNLTSVIGTMSGAGYAGAQALTDLFSITANGNDITFTGKKRIPT